MPERSHLRAAASLAALALATFTAAEAQAVENAHSVLDATPAPNAQEPVSPLAALSVEASQDGTTATLKFGAQQNDISWVGGKAKGHFRTGSLTLSGPVDAKKGFGSPLTHDGLANAASLTLQLSELVVPAADFAAVDNGPVCGEIREGFAAQNAGKPFPGCDTDLAWTIGAKASADRYNAATDKEPICGELRRTFRDWNPEAVVPPCSADLASTVGGQLLARKYNDAMDAALAARRLTYGGVFAKVGLQSYTFYDPATLAKSDVDRTPWRAGAFYAWIGGRENWAVTVQYAHEESFKEGDSKVACPVGSGPVVTCVSGALERVKRVSKDVLSLEGRWARSSAPLGIAKAKFGVAPKIAYDANGKDWALALPVYLFGDKTGLTGGVRADWESNDHDWVVGVFITKTFSISDAR